MTRFGFIFRTAERTFRSGERTFRSGERTFRSAEHKPNTLQRYIKTRYYANIYPTIFIHLQRVSSGQRNGSVTLNPTGFLFGFRKTTR